MNFDPVKVNEAFIAICPELKSKYAVYPIPSKYGSRWLNFDGKDEDGNPVVQLSKTDQGYRKNYVYCKNAPKGPGYYHILTQVAYVNLYSRLSAEGSGAKWWGGATARSKQWDTTRRIVYNRSRASCPDDAKGAVQAINHMECVKANPLHGITG